MLTLVLAEIIEWTLKALDLAVTSIANLFPKSKKK